MKSLSRNITHHFYHQIKNEELSFGSEYDLAKLRVRRNKIIIFDLLLNKSNIFEWKVSLLFFVINDKKLSSSMAQISEHINSSNHKIHSYDQVGKMIVNLSNKKTKTRTTPQDISIAFRNYY